jgi:tetratricopeptide (TPR) repeat protein
MRITRIAAHAYRLLVAAPRLRLTRRVAFAEYSLAQAAAQAGRLGDAAAAFGRAADIVRKTGPQVGFGFDWLTLPQVLLAHGSVLLRQGDVAGAEQTFLCALDEQRNVGWHDDEDEGITLAMSICESLVQLYEMSFQKRQHATRLRMWHALLAESGIGTPSDTPAWVLYALRAASSAEEVDDVVTRARRICAAPQQAKEMDRRSLLAGWLSQAGGLYSKFGARRAANTTIAEAEALIAPPAHAAEPAAANTLSYERADELCRLARAHLARGAPGANIGALRALVAAAHGLPAAARGTIFYAELLLDICKLTPMDALDAMDGVPDVVIALPEGGEARLLEPRGWGLIAISEAALQCCERTFSGARMAELLHPLNAHIGMMTRLRDVLGAQRAQERVATLSATLLGDAHPSTLEAASAAAGTADSLTQLHFWGASMLGMHEPARTRREVQALVLELEARRIACVGAGAPLPGVASAEVQRAARAAVRSQRACAGCSAVPAKDVPPFRVCEACLSVSYCSAACAKQHWRTHKADCKLLRKSEAAAVR